MNENNIDQLELDIESIFHQNEVFNLETICNYLNKRFQDNDTGEKKVYSKYDVDNALFNLVYKRKLIYFEKLELSPGEYCEYVYSLNQCTKYIINDSNKKIYYFADILLKYDINIDIYYLEESSFVEKRTIHKNYLIGLIIDRIKQPIINYSLISHPNTKYKAKFTIDYDYTTRKDRYTRGVYALWGVLKNRYLELNHSLNIILISEFLDKIIELIRENTTYVYSEENNICNLMEEAKINNCNVNQPHKTSKYNYPEGLNKKEKLLYYAKYIYPLLKQKTYIENYKEYYEVHKNDPEIKMVRNINQKKYYEKNKSDLKYKEKMKIRSKQYSEKNKTDLEYKEKKKLISKNYYETHKNDPQFKAKAKRYSETYKNVKSI